MNIALVGYGKMGKIINELISRDKQHQVVLRINSANVSELNHLKKYETDVVIDFSKPDVVVANMQSYIQQNIPAVIGTTGWYHQLTFIKELTLKHGASLIWGSNFSIGVNVFFRINDYAAKLLKHYSEYQVQIHEVHHKNKIDKPSGTAITLRNIIQQHLSLPNELPIHSERDDNSVGHHEVVYQSAIDNLILTHHANNREGFAIGSIRAASWIIQHKGFYNFADIFEQL